jgi:hypothetical protein
MFTSVAVVSIAVAGFDADGGEKFGGLGAREVPASDVGFAAFVAGTLLELAVHY